MRVNHPNASPTQANESERSRRTNQTEETKRPNRAASEGASSVDLSSVRAEISPRAKEMAMAKDIASKAPDVREERIAELKRRIAAGEYNVKPDDIADKLVDEHIRSR